MGFELHPRLAAAGPDLGRLFGCRLVLKDNALFPWLILVPEVADAEELHLLDPEVYQATMAAVRRVSQFVADHFAPEKINVGCVGNKVRQLHVHIVGRFSSDPAWPGTVWAFDGKKPYAPEEIEMIRSAARMFLQLA